MDNAELPRIIYLVLLGTALCGWFVAENRKNLGQTARMALAWGLIFLGVIAAYGLWGDIRDDVMPRQSVQEDGRLIEVPRSPDGHFHMTLEMNGVPVDFLVDTGASDMVLSLQDARKIGLNPDELAFLGSARTANGVVKTAFARADEVTIGALRFERVPLSVNSGAMNESLLGMSFLSRFDRFEIRNDVLTLER